MRPPRRPRLLSGEERHLWGEIAKLVTPLRGRAVLKKTADAADPMAPLGAAAAKGAAGAGARAGAKRAPASPPSEPASTPRPAPPRAAPKRAVKLGDLTRAPRAPLPSVPVPVPMLPVQPPSAGPGGPGLDWRERRRVHRGLLPIEARIDLHGLYQAQAHDALVGFLIRARAAGHARVLVVTGKGGASFAGTEDRLSERGVLRRSVPHWLRGPELRGLVLGFEEAARHHGGAGALYVRLRRR